MNGVSSTRPVGGIVFTKAGGLPWNHNESLVRVQKPTQAFKVKTHVKAGIVIVRTDELVTLPT